MSRTHSPSATRPYGLARVCRVWRCGRSTVYRHRQAEAGPSPLRRRSGPQGPMSDAALAEHIASCLPTVPSMAKATGRSGPACAMRGSEPVRVGCCG